MSFIFSLQVQSVCFDQTGTLPSCGWDRYTVSISQSLMYLPPYHWTQWSVKRLHFQLLLYLFLYRIYLCKQWNLLKTFTDHAGAVTGVRFGKNASFVASVSMDRSLKYFGS